MRRHGMAWRGFGVALSGKAKAMHQLAQQCTGIAKLSRGTKNAEAERSKAAVQHRLGIAQNR